MTIDWIYLLFRGTFYKNDDWMNFYLVKWILIKTMHTTMWQYSNGAVKSWKQKENKNKKRKTNVKMVE